MSVARRLTALLVALLLSQSIWERSGAACMTAHGMVVGEVGTMPTMSESAMPGHVPAAPQVDSGASHEDVMAGTAGTARPSADEEAPAPSHCPDFGLPPVCATMAACSAVAVSPVTGLLLASEGRQTGERLPEPVTRPLSLAPAPDVPPPRA